MQEQKSQRKIGTQGELSIIGYYAGQALAGLAANPDFSATTDTGVKVIANRAWALAIEMMEYYTSDDE